MKVFLVMMVAFIVFTTYIASEEQLIADEKMEAFINDPERIWTCLNSTSTPEGQRRYVCKKLKGRMVLVEQYKNNLMFSAKRASRRKVVLWGN